MEKYYRMVIDLYKEVLLINRVNPDRVLDAQREISNAITTAIITNEPTGELELLKSDIENLKSHISMNTVISKQIMERFYSALDAIIAMKKIRGVNTYCRLNNIDRRNFIAQRKDLERGWFQLSWLYPMVKEYGVSAKWLLTGFGRMFEEQK